MGKSLANYGLREATCKTLGLSLIDIPDIRPTASGFAIWSRNKMIRQRILAKEQELGHCLKATKVELPTKWFKRSKRRTRSIRPCLRRDNQYHVLPHVIPFTSITIFATHRKEEASATTA